MFPWIINHRTRLQDDGDPKSNEYLDCGSCMLSKEQRCRVRCGWLPEQERTGIAPVPAEYPGEVDVCPGYMMEMPQVMEAARANEWRKTGNLRELYGDVKLTPLVKIGVDVVESAQRQVQNHNALNPPERK